MRAICAYIIYIPMGILCRIVLVVSLNLLDSEMPKQSAKRRLLYVRIPPTTEGHIPDVGWIRVQRYEKILNYANKNAKNVRKIYENVRNLTESAIKELIPESYFGAMEEERRRRRKLGTPSLGFLYYFSRHYWNKKQPQITFFQILFGIFKFFH